MRRWMFLIILISALLVTITFLKAEQFSYDSHGKRDPLIPLIGQEKQANRTIALSEVESIDDVVLEGIAAETAGHKTAIINGELVKEGFKSGEVQIKKINKNSITLAISGKDYTINLYQEGDLKSE